MSLETTPIAQMFYCGKGTHANRPADGSVPDGSLYYETDTHDICQMQSAVWVVIFDYSAIADNATGIATNAAAIAAIPDLAVGEYTGDGTTGRQITTGFICKGVILVRRHDTTPTTYISMAPDNTYDCISLTNPDSVGASGVPYMHASDGFVVSGSSTNANSQVYLYIAWGA